MNRSQWSVAGLLVAVVMMVATSQEVVRRDFLDSEVVDGTNVWLDSDRPQVRYRLLGEVEMAGPGLLSLSLSQPAFGAPLRVILDDCTELGQQDPTQSESWEVLCEDATCTMERCATIHLDESVESFGLRVQGVVGVYDQGGSVVRLHAEMQQEEL